MAGEIWREYFPSIISGEQIEYMLDEFLSPEKLSEDLEQGYHSYWIIDAKDEKSGFAHVHFDHEYSMLPSLRGFFISKIYLKKDARGKGLGKLSLLDLERLAREHGSGYMYLTVNRHNRLAISAYERRDFRIVGQAKKDIGSGYVMDDFIMVKTLIEDRGPR